jgi:exodeoxyribonuclease VIII
MSSVAQKLDPRLGVFKEISHADYHGKPFSFAYSSSDLKAAFPHVSGVIAKRAMPKDTDALRLGHAFHMRVEHFKNQDKYLEKVEVKLDGRTTEGIAQKKKIDNGEIKKTLISEKEWKEIELCLAGYLAHPTTADLLESDGIAEETFIWEDADTGVLCKCRTDYRIPHHPVYGDNVLVDWKTAASCDEEKLRYAIQDYKYHLSAAFYSDGVRAVLGGDNPPFVNAFVEKGSGGVVPGLVNNRDLERGRELYKDALTRIAKAEKSGIWIGFVDLSLPRGGF